MALLHKKHTKYKSNIPLMQRFLNAGYPLDQMWHHGMDLYVYVTPVTKPIVEAWCKENGYRIDHSCPTFKDNVTGRKMYDCAFQYITELGEVQNG